MKILVIGNLFHNYDIDIVDALIELNHDVRYLFNNIYGPFNTLGNYHKKIVYGILPEKFSLDYFKEKQIRNYNSNILKILKKEKFNLIITIGGKSLTTETLERIKIPIVLWFMDDINRYTQVKQNLHLYDKVFFFEPTNTKLIKQELNINTEVLHLAFNPKRFYPIKNINKRYKISFIGSNYPNREEILGLILESGIDVKIIGDFYKSKNLKIKSNLIKKQAKTNYINEIYNSSEINLNIHHPQSVEGLNVRTYEIMGAGGIQLVENQKVCKYLFNENDDIFLYSSYSELIDKINSILNLSETRKKEIRENTYLNAIKNHTWRNRLQEMLNFLENNNII